MAINEGAGGPKSGSDVVVPAEKVIDPAILEAVRVAREEVRSARGDVLAATGNEASPSSFHPIVMRRFHAGSPEYISAIEMLAGMETQYDAQIALYVEANFLVKDAAGDRWGCVTPDGVFQPVPLFAHVAQVMMLNYPLCIEKIADGFTVPQVTPQSLPLSEVNKLAERFLGRKFGDFMIEDAGQFETGSVSAMHPRGRAYIPAPQSNPDDQFWTVSLRKPIMGGKAPSGSTPVVGGVFADGRLALNGDTKEALLKDGEAFATLHDTTLAFMAELATGQITEQCYHMVISAGTLPDPQDAQGPAYPITMFASEDPGMGQPNSLRTQAHFFVNVEPDDLFARVVPLLVPHGINQHPLAKAI
ncbi:hypothetical protein KA517_00085 [Candidatus Gracilibacteria bacterium]|nr:hypothetical protein [Candidatus Gracilibacteria bacterium]